MTDDSRGQTPPVGGQEPQTDPQGAAGVPGQEPERFDAEYVRKLRGEAGEYRKRLRELEARVKASDDAQLSEVERLRKALAEREQQDTIHKRQRQESSLRLAALSAAMRLNMIDGDIAYKLLDLAAVEFGESDEPKNVDVLLRDLVKSHPYLVRQPAAPAVTATNPQRGGGPPLTRDDIRKMSPEQINERWDEVKRALAAGR